MDCKEGGINYKPARETMVSASVKQLEAPSTEAFCVTYSARDVILFALAIGFGSSEEHYDQDLRFVYEEHERFEVVPLWGLALPFWAHLHGKKPLLPLFPPPIMSSMGLIPRSNLRGDGINLNDFPVLHMFQSIEWHAPFPSASRDNTTTLQLHPSFQMIQPKSLGTFVMTETIVVHEKSHLCSIHSTALILGLPAENVIPCSNRKNVTRKGKTMHSKMGNVWIEKLHTVDSNVALLYRLASGDTNRIHVLPVVSEKPLLHGLCTLAICAACIMQKLPDCDPTMLQGNFTKPIFLNDTFLIRVWKRDSLEFDFIVYNKTREEVCVDRGYFALKRKEQVLKTSRL